MSQYQRMVSYLYRYEDDVKKNNTGYARIERRGDSCRITVQLRDSLSELPEVAFFRQEERGAQLIPAGRLKKNGNGFGCRIETRVDNIMDTGNAFSDVDGLVVFISDALYYATTWKDVTVHFGRGVLDGGKEESEWGKRQDAGEKEDADVRKEEDTEWNPVSTGPEEENAGWAPSVIRLEPEVTAGKAEGTAREAESADRKQESADRKPEQAENLEAASRPEETQEQTPSAGKESVPEDNADAIAACQCEACRQCPQRRRSVDFGHHILSVFPRMYPFEVENIKECVRLELKDIGCLPVPYWSLAGNPFLLHGYYCYRHILFAGGADGKYYIGVPGIYNRENEGQAKSCGFVRFEALSRVADRRGAFGYWLFPVGK